MPVWQRFWDEHQGTTARFVTVAADADLERAGLFADRVLLTTLVDVENDLARVFGYRAIPNGFAFDRTGALTGTKIAGFDVRDHATRELAEAWIAASASQAVTAPTTAAIAPEPSPDVPEPSPEALDLFAAGSRLMREGRRDEALAAWGRAFEKDPKNFVIRKQIWRALYPDRFGDPIDLAWQKEQIAREDAQGFAPANPGLPR